MNKYVFILGFSFLYQVASAQELPIPWVDLSVSDSTSATSKQANALVVPADSLPFITMKTEPALVAVAVASVLLPVIPGAWLFIGCHSYTIQNRKKFTPKVVKPYFLATRDAALLDLYNRHRQNRVIWYAGTSTGVVVGVVGFIQMIVSIFDPTELEGATTKILIGGSLLAGGQVARVVSFRQLRKSVNLYNYQYTSDPRRVSLHVGISSQTPAGGAVYLRF